MPVDLEVLCCIYHFQRLLLTAKVSTKCSFLAYIPALTKRLPHLSCITRISICCLANFTAFTIIFPLFDYLKL